MFINGLVLMFAPFGFVGCAMMFVNVLFFWRKES